MLFSLVFPIRALRLQYLLTAAIGVGRARGYASPSHILGEELRVHVVDHFRSLLMDDRRTGLAKMFNLYTDTTNLARAFLLPRSRGRVGVPKEGWGASGPYAR